MTDAQKTLIEWISKNAWMESRFAQPNPAWHVPMVGLLDKIAEVFEIPKDEIAAIVNGDEDEEEAP